MLIEAGTRLTARHMMLAAAANCAELSVRARPRVAILSTGDELVAPGEKPGPDQIVSSNSTGLAALIHHCGGEPVELGIVPDNLTKIRRAILHIGRDIGGTHNHHPDIRSVGADDQLA